MVQVTLLFYLYETLATKGQKKKKNKKGCGAEDEEEVVVQGSPRVSKFMQADTVWIFSSPFNLWANLIRLIFLSLSRIRLMRTEIASIPNFRQYY